MMNSYRPNKSRRTLLFATIAVIVVFVIDGVSGGLFRNTLRTVSTRVWTLGSGIFSIVAESGFVASRRALLENNEALTQEVLQLHIRTAGYQILKQENASLKNIVRLAKADPGITAPIISSFISSPYGTFVVGAGKADGVSEGDLILTGESDAGLSGKGGFVVGRVSEVGEHSSLVTEVFAPNAQSEVTVQGIALKIEGQGGGNARAESPRTPHISEGDPVISPLLGGRGVGIVGAVEEDSARSRQIIYIRFPVALSDLRFVYVVSSAQ